ncbi:MAG TPA: hydantoinase/oxoprolinase family protein [Nitrospiria bacterium]|jgi:N-methylhydantoinase A
MIRIGIDTGGTFTDIIVLKGNKLTVHKIPSTPENPSQAILKGIKEIPKNSKQAIVFHGTTVATNALLERKGARVVLLTTINFEDILEIGRQNRPDLYNLWVQRSVPLVKSGLRVGVRERIAYNGKVIEPLTRLSIQRALTQIKKLKPQSLAICFLHSYANRIHEKKVEKEARKLSIPISISSHILPEYREVERFSTTVVNAYVSPIMNRYLDDLSKGLQREYVLRIMQSNGGFTNAKTASSEAVRTLLSGPAAGVVAAHTLGKKMGFPNLITFDMGGTSTDVSLCPGELPFTAEGEIAGCSVKTPFIRIHTIGAGGGSVAWVDQGGLLRVGPESAGADPGPICYNRGGKKITVTDAHLFLGRLDPVHFLGGNMELNRDEIQKPFNQMSRKLKISPQKLAEGIIQVANANMEKAIRVVSVEQGQDPKDFALCVFGGAGGLHGADLAKTLKIPMVFIPKNPGLFSALGLLLSDSIKEYAQAILGKEKQFSPSTLEAGMNRLIHKGTQEMNREGISTRQIHVFRFLDMRYKGQSHELTIPYSRHYYNSFHESHRKRYGHMEKNRAVEIVNIRIRLIGKFKKPIFKSLPEKPLRSLEKAKLKENKAIFSGKPWKTPFIDRNHLTPGTKFPGPAIIIEFTATTTVPPGFYCHVDRFENLILEQKL